MCELNGNYWNPRRPVDIAKCHCFYALRERQSVTVRDYLGELCAISMTHRSIERSLLGDLFLDENIIVAWRLDGTPMLQRIADFFSFSKTQDIRNRCLDLWNDAADEDGAEYSSIEDMDVCHVCGGLYAWTTTNGTGGFYKKNRKPNWAHLPNLQNHTKFSSCQRMKCKKVAKAALAVGLKKDSHYRAKKPYTLYLLQEALKNGGNNQIFRWLKKNAFRNA